MANSCVDSGPWVCLEPGCPRPNIDCALLARHKACGLTFNKIWTTPPPEVNASARIHTECRLTCRACSAFCQRDDDVCEPHKCWAVLRRGVLDGRVMDHSFDGARHWLFGKLLESPAGRPYGDGFDMALVRAPERGPSRAVRQNHTMSEPDVCIVERCASEFAACASEEECRDEWTSLLGTINATYHITRLRTAEDIARADVRALFRCHVAQCVCIHFYFPSCP